MPRPEVVAILTAHAEKLERLQKQADVNAAERVGIRGGYGYIVGAVGFLLSMLMLWKVLST